MKLLITGVGGFLGNHLTSLFCQSGKHTIHAIYNKKKPENFKKSVKLIKSNVSKLNISGHYNFVIHCASKTRVNNENNKNLYYDNVMSIKQILKKISFDKFFFMSSNSVYGNITQTKINEYTRLNANDFYARSKIKCEQILQRYSKKNQNKIFVFRLPAVVGVKSHSNFISNLMNSYKCHNFDTIKINNKNDLFNNTIHAEEIYKFIKNLLFNKKTKRYNLFVLGSKSPIKLTKILSICDRFFNKKISHHYVVSKIHNKLVDFSKSLKYGFKPIKTSNTILKMLKENCVKK
jgi:nucleoside-diphosphate-sugar epimerase